MHKLKSEISISQVQFIAGDIGENKCLYLVKLALLALFSGEQQLDVLDDAFLASDARGEVSGVLGRTRQQVRHLLLPPEGAVETLRNDVDPALDVLVEAQLARRPLL